MATPKKRPTKGKGPAVGAEPRTGRKRQTAAPTSSSTPQPSGDEPRVLPTILPEPLPRVPTRDEFVGEFPMADQLMEETGTSWETLAEIGQRHLLAIGALQSTANFIAERLRQVATVHSVKVRIKNPSHLMEKVLRKCKVEPERRINPQNYAEEITDLIGIRALHLFKTDWPQIHRFVTGYWPLRETPTAYVRDGDSTDLIRSYESEGCIVRRHPAGYRSVHYLVESQPARERHIAELQVRTIFEEAWSEIDHHIRYPHNVENEVLSQFLEVFNRMAGSADEMGTFIQFLQREMSERDVRHAAAVNQYEKTIKALREEVAALAVTKEQKAQLERRITELEASKRSSATVQFATSDPRGDSRFVGSPGALNSLASMATPTSYWSRDALTKVSPPTYPLGLSAFGTSPSFLTGILVSAQCPNCGQSSSGPFCPNCLTRK